MALMWAGLVPITAAALQARDKPGQAISVTASQPGDKAAEKHTRSRLCHQPAAGLQTTPKQQMKEKDKDHT